MRFATKLGLITLVGTLFIAPMMGIGVFHYAKQIIQERIIYEQFVSAENLMRQINNNIHNALIDVQMIAADELLQQYMQKPSTPLYDMLNEELEERVKLTGPWEALLIFNMQGDETFAFYEDTPVHSEHPLSRIAYEHARNGENYYSDYSMSDVSGKPVLLIASPIYSGNGASRVIGVVVAHFSWDVIQNTLNQAAPLYTVHLLDRSKRLIATKDSDIPITKHRNLDAFYRTLFRHDGKNGAPASDSAFITSMHDNEETLAVYVTQKEEPDFIGNGWILLLQQPLDLAFAPVKKMAGITIIIMFGGMLFFIFFNMAAIRRFIAPLNLLVEGVRRVGKGHLDERVDIVSSDEIGELGRSFNAMVSALQESTVSKKELNDIIDTTLSSLIVLGPDLTIHSVNRSSLELLGYREKELLGSHFGAIAPETAGQLAAAITGCSDTVRNLQISYRTQKGAQTPVLFSASALCGPSGEIRNIICSAVDIAERQAIAEALEKSEARFRSLVETSLDLFWEIDEEGRYTYISPKVKDILGYEPEAVIGMSAFDLMPDREGKRVMAIFESLKNRHSPISLLENIMLHKEGHKVYMETSAVPLLDSDGKLLGYQGIDRDITARKEAEAALQASEQRFERLAHNINEIFWFRELGKEPKLYVTPAFEDIWGIATPQLYEHPELWIERIFETDRKRLLDAFDALLSGSEKEFTVEYRIVHTDGSTRWIRDRGTAIADASGNIYQISGIATDITEYKKVQEEITHQAYHDFLTGLPNREMLMQSLDRELAHAQRLRSEVVVLFIDLDDFKLLNDTLGHEAGDELLRQVATRLQETLRTTDILARHGGDEFILLMANRKESVEYISDFTILASTVAERIIGLLKRPFHLLDQTVHIGASIGISSYPGDADSPMTLLQHADSAMYRAKEMGRGCYQYYSSELSQQQSDRLSLLNKIHTAIDKHAFSLEYQPIVDLPTGKMIGVEALIRWNRGDGTKISPAEFIPLAEESGLIITIGKWVLEEACRQQKAWIERGIELTVAVNLSVRQFSQERLIEQVTEAIDRAAIPRGSIELEVTETAMVYDAKRTEEILNEFHAKGLHISLDDFGTGYSSLNRLKRLSISKLKVDKSFVDGILTDEKDSAIVTTTIQLAHNLNIPALAEGIETEAQRHALMKMGCEYGQGYYFSTSLPPEEIERLALEQHPLPPGVIIVSG